MVRYSSLLLSSSRVYSSSFIDTLRINVRGGSGGAGLVHLGGVGGRGGDVYLVGAKQENLSLKNLKEKFPSRRFTAEAGESSSRRALSGMNGRSIYVQIPHGISVKDSDTGETIGSVNKPGDRVLVARGGKGGDRFNGFKSRKGRMRSIVLDLRLIADVGFVGFPNAGKSSLLNAISNAKPEVADYPFTTLRPHIGVVNYKDFRKISCADLPGLIEGAHANLGMGHKFLKHIERTKVLLFVVDLFGFSLNTNQNIQDAFENIQLLTKELELYNRDLVSRPAMLALNKIDLEGAKEKYEILSEKLGSWQDHLSSIPSDMIPEKQMNFSKVMTISAKDGSSLSELRIGLRQLIDESASKHNFFLDGDCERKSLELLDSDATYKTASITKRSLSCLR